MTRWVAAGVSLAIAAACAWLIGGPIGAESAGFALPLLALGLLFGRAALVTAGPLLLAFAYLAPLVLFGGALDPRAPLLAAGLLVALEAGHLALDGDRYDLPGGAGRLAHRTALLGGVVVLSFGAGWAILLAASWRAPAGPAGGVVAGAAAVAVLLALRFLRPPALSSP